MANIYQQALDAQSAVNLSGLAQSLAKFTIEIWDEANAASKGTDYVNRHPVVRLMLWQMWFLAFGAEPRSVDWNIAYSRAYDECRAKAAE